MYACCSVARTVYAPVYHTVSSSGSPGALKWPV